MLTQLHMKVMIMISIDKKRIHNRCHRKCLSTSLLLLSTFLSRSHIGPCQMNSKIKAG